ncbi:MAG: helix-turn-helix transcriptional regulator, partial [Chloroflexi bacterium]|nr:helix-turn-helix transcriptional regulator [Chloroflexota bacterium]
MTDERRSATIESLGDKELRDFYVSDHISEGVSFQIRAMREGRGWTQQEFGRLAGMAQERVSQLEDPDYGRLSLTTLKRVASAFDVALIVRFAPFSDLVDWAI